MNSDCVSGERTEHVLQADDAGQVVVKVDVEGVVSKPQAHQLQELVVQLHPCIQEKHRVMVAM